MFFCIRNGEKAGGKRAGRKERESEGGKGWEKGSALTLDVAHINERPHGVTQEEAVSYIKNAAFSLKRRHWTGETFLNYYSEEGASYVRTSDNVIRTSFKKDEFDKKTKSAMEVLKNGE